MAKTKPQETIQLYDPKNHYRSVEGKIQDYIVNTTKKTAKNIADFTKPTRQAIVRGTKHTNDFIGEFIPYFSQIGTSTLRIPTIFRKNYNHQLRLQLQDMKKLTKAQKAGAVSGYIFGGIIAPLSLIYTLNRAIEGDINPIMALGASNIGSGLYEAGRIKESRKENKGLKNKITIEPRKDE